MIIEFGKKQKDDKKSGITVAFYSAYFAKHEKLSGDDLQKVLDKIDNPENEEMSDEAMLAAVKRFVGG